MLHFFVPQRRNIIDLDVAINQRAFNFIAQNDVCRIAHLIRVDADKARLDALIPGDEVFAAKGRLFAKVLAYRWQQALQKGVAAAKLHLEKQALRLMDRRRTGEGDGLIEPVTRQILFIARVAGFVDHAKQRAEQVVFVVARGDTHILGDAAAEWVGADIQASAVKIKS